MAQEKLNYIKTILYSTGQIMLQGNALTGLFFLAGIFSGSVTMGIAAFLAVNCGALTAKFFDYHKKETQQGLYGFSAALVGVALILFLKPGFIVWFLIVIGSVSATVIQHFFIRRKIPVFTLPFVLVTWLIILLAIKFSPALLADPSVANAAKGYDFTFALRGYGQVIFQDKILPGILFFIGVFISSPIAALYGLAGSIIAGMLSQFFSVPTPDIGLGLFSYNAVLCAIVFAGTKINDGFWVLISVLLSVFISIWMYHSHLVQLTFPFVAASCITLLIKRYLSLKRQKK